MVSNGVRVRREGALMLGRRGSADATEQRVFWSGLVWITSDYTGLLGIAEGEKFEGFIWLD